MSRSFATCLLALTLSCGSTGGPGDEGGTDGGAAAHDGGFVRADGGTSTTPEDGGTTQPLDGGLTPVDGGATEDGGSPQPDGGPADDAGAPELDGGTIPCVGTDISGQWTGTFDGDVWWTTDPTTTEPIAGNLEFTLTCNGVKYAVSGTMTGDESHGVTFTATLSGEVSGGQLAANITGQIVFATLPTVPLPFTGTMGGAVSGTTIPAGTWEGQSTLLPAAGDGTWQAARQ